MTFKQYLLAVALMTGLLGSNVLQADIQKTVLDVKNMTCASCYYIVNKSLKRVNGVIDVQFPARATAVVTYNDAVCTVEALIEATTMLGFPSSVKNKES
jgi:mercuric ion binding protein